MVGFFAKLIATLRDTSVCRDTYLQKRCFRLHNILSDILWSFCPWSLRFCSRPQFLSSPLLISIKFSSYSDTEGENIYISKLSSRLLRDCVNDYLWTKPMPRKYPYKRFNIQTTCLKPPGCISCTVIPHCLSSNRNTLARATAACLLIQYSPLLGNVRRPK